MSLRPGIHAEVACLGLAVLTFIMPQAPAVAQDSNRPISLMAGLGRHHHPVSTANPTAQRYFDQGLSFVYAFNHDAAIRSFRRAAEVDPNLAMARWGIGLALGPNINMDVDPDREKAAFEEAQKALALARAAPEEERAYVEALVKRYSADSNADLKKLAVDFKNAMGDLARRYPDDLDAATLYAESMMDLRPWQLWSADGKPAEDTEQIVAALESVLKRNPDHLGANHYYIHAVEASPHPERALESARRLEALAPAAGHLVHMPAHIYMRVGDYAAAARRNEFAALADQDYIQSCGVQGVYPMMYYSHNLHFLAVANALRGRFNDSIKAARQLAAHVGPAVKEMPPLEGFMPTPLFVLLRFGRWQDILQYPEPAPDMKSTIALWHFARGMALAATGDSDQAPAELATFQSIREAAPPEAMFGNNRVKDVLGVGEETLAARIALARQDRKTAIDHLRKAVTAEDNLRYDEPPGWYLFSREALGGVLLANGEFAEAEKVFRADLDRNPRKGPSLFGLVESLKGQGRGQAARLVDMELETAWKAADAPIKPADIWAGPACDAKDTPNGREAAKR